MIFFEHKLILVSVVHDAQTWTQESLLILIPCSWMERRCYISHIESLVLVFRWVFHVILHNSWVLTDSDVESTSFGWIFLRVKVRTCHHLRLYWLRWFLIWENWRRSKLCWFSSFGVDWSSTQHHDVSRVRHVSRCLWLEVVSLDKTVWSSKLRLYLDISSLLFNSRTLLRKRLEF